ncbi:MAG TPA: glycosyltransferase family 2 protein [Gemmataceae bacterium]|jgi:GT2 family glycosyltransferase|nr:glycosyltransferase family 2 protein [Gemmataceae bacterium]
MALAVSVQAQMGRRQADGSMKKTAPPSAFRLPPSAQPRLSVVIVNYGQWQETSDLVRQLQGGACARRGAAEVVVVDNHSAAHPLGARLRRLNGISLRRWGRNRGFARAANEGCRLSSGDWCLLLNPDVTVSSDFLDRVLELADGVSARDPHAGIIGFQLRNSDGSLQLSSGFFPTLIGTLAGLARPRTRRKYRELSLRQRSRTCWVTGCCLLVRRACLQQLGGLDEDFFLYYEDVDLCRRARARGWSVWYEPALQVVHHRPLHSRDVPAHLRLVTRHALLTYGARHWPAWQAGLLARVVQAESWFRKCWAFCRGRTSQAALFAETAAIASAMARGKHVLARGRLRRAVRREENRPQDSRVRDA